MSAVELPASSSMDSVLTAVSTYGLVFDCLCVCTFLELVNLTSFSMQSEFELNDGSVLLLATSYQVSSSPSCDMRLPPLSLVVNTCVYAFVWACYFVS